MLLVSCFKGLQDLVKKRNSLFQRNRLSFEKDLSQCFSWDKFRADVMEFFSLPISIDGDNVEVGKTCGCLSFSHDPFSAFGHRRGQVVLLRDKLQCDRSVEDRVMGFKDHPHGTGSDELIQFKLMQFVSQREP